MSVSHSSGQSSASSLAQKNPSTVLETVTEALYEKMHES